MRFSRNLHRHQVPSWADAYVNYDGLKEFLNTKPSPEYLQEAVRLETDMVDAFFSRRSGEINGDIKAAEARWGIHLGSADASTFHRVSMFELGDLKSTLLAIASDIAQLEWYLRVNHEAVLRISQKAAATAGDVLPPKPAVSWIPPHAYAATSLSALNATLQAVCQASERDDQDTPLRSLLLEQAPKHRFPPRAVHWIWEDDAVSLGEALDREHYTPSPDAQSALIRLLQVAIVHRSYGCQRLLLSRLRSSQEETASEDHDYLHRIIQQLGRSRSSTEPLPPADYFRQLLKLLHPTQLLMLRGQDRLGCSPLHYAASLGLESVCREIITNLRSNHREELNDMILNCPNAAGHTVLDCAVHRGHVAVVDILIHEVRLPDGPRTVPTMGESDLLAVAISCRFEDVCVQLISEGWGLHFVSRSGKTVLHKTAEQGLVKVTQSLVACMSEIDSKTHAKGLTPLAVACIQGHSEIVDVLLRAGADPNARDNQGWLPKDHAAYRGYPKIAEAIACPGSKSLTAKPGKRLGATIIQPRPSATESVIFVSLGTLDLNKEVTVIDLAPYRAKISPVEVLETSLVLTIATDPESGQEYRVPLPVISDESDWPRCFTTSHPHNAKIIFKVFSDAEPEPVGTAVALLQQLKEGLGPKRESLVRDFTIPIVSSKHGHVGSVTFTFVIARPTDPNLSPPTEPQHLKLEALTALGGHRGNGQNDDSHRYLQLGENTIQSFQTAIDHGASVVEFDVQLTKDDVPVVYHDFLVAEKGTDATMHTVTYDQFTAIDNAQSAQVPDSPAKRLPWDERARPRPPLGSRRCSLCAPQHCDTTALVKQMEHTSNYPGYKGNLRSENIREPFVTLERMFHSIPDDVVFDIEIKYPMLYEAVDFKMDTFAPELNHFLDTILSVTYAHAGPRRRIIFTSFSPEICMTLAVKQRTYPILFLNDSSNWPTGDQRATSTQTAVRFAHRFGLAGVVMASEPFIASPGLVGLVRKQGLYTSTYGPLNDDANCAKIQAEAGLDLLIVNRVKYIKQALNGLKGAA